MNKDYTFLIIIIRHQMHLFVTFILFIFLLLLINKYYNFLLVRRINNDASKNWIFYVDHLMMLLFR